MRISGQLEDGVGESGGRSVESSQQEENRLFRQIKNSKSDLDLEQS
jgi:hypothetical protein